MFRLVCAKAQTRQNFRYLHTQSVDVDKDSKAKFRFLVLLRPQAWAFKIDVCAYAISTKISYDGPVIK